LPNPKKRVLTQDNNQHKLLERRIEESERRYRGLYESSPLSLTVTDSDGVILNINSATEKIIGFKKSEVIGKKYFDLGIFSPKQVERFKKDYKEALKGKKISPMEIQIKRKDGTIAWLSVQNSLRKIGNEILIEGITQDITERKTAEQKLIESQKKYKDLANSLPEVIFEIDLNFKLTYTNAIASQIFGYSHEDFKKGLNIFHFISPEEKERVLENLSRIFKGELIEPIILQLRKKDGSFFYGNINATPIFKGSKIVGMRSIIHDVTEMVNAEEKIKESEAKFRTISEQSLMGISIIQDERIKYANETLANILGYSIEEILNWSPGEFFKTIHPKDKKRVIELSTKKANHIDNGVRYYEVRGIHKNGNIIWLEVYSKIITFQKKPAFLVSYIDISERKKVKEELRESEDKYRFLFEKSPSSILLINKSGRVEDCNPALEKLIDYDRTELIGKRSGRLPIIPPKYLSVLLKRIKRISDGESIPSVDIQLIKKDGSLIWVNIDSSVVKMGDKTYIYL
jgi:PAS domain S-box-containing protein